MIREDRVMVKAEFDSLRERDLAIDLEKGRNAGFVSSDGTNKNEENVGSANHHLLSAESPIENGVVLVDKRCGGGGERGELSPLEKKKVEGKKPKKKSCKKPPRPPRAPSLDAADQKLIQEFSEVAMLKRARIERMKALKKMKNAKSASSGSNLFALLITIIFCIVIIWQGLFSTGGSSVSFHGSPESSMGTRGGFISIQLYKNTSTHHDSSSASPNNMELMSGLDEHRDASRGTGYAVRRILRSKD